MNIDTEVDGWQVKAEVHYSERSYDAPSGWTIMLHSVVPPVGVEEDDDDRPSDSVIHCQLKSEYLEVYP